MKSNLRRLNLLFAILSILSSCQKQITKSRDEIGSLPVNSTSSDCKAIGLAVSNTSGNGSTPWSNILLKWYDGSGQLRNIKFNVDFYSGVTGGKELWVDYGEVTYVNDEVHLRDVLYNQEVLAARLDAMKRPIVSMYNSYGRTNIGTDTAYYYYSSNRIDYIVEHERYSGFDQTVVITWDFSYDPDGNLVTVTPRGGTGGYEFHYDYTQLNHGITTLHVISPSFSALEYMDLLHFNYHHQLSYVLLRADSGYPVMAWVYDGGVTKDSDGKITSYSYAYGQTWYTAWDCNGSSMIQSRNPTQEDFMKLIKN